MFIRAVEHKNKKNRKKYRTYKLVDSVRTERGPRQTTVLNLGSDFSLPKEDWKQLANCIEEIVTDQQSIFGHPPKIKKLADGYASRIIQKQSVVITFENRRSPDYATVDLNSLKNEKPRTAGAEHVAYETLKLLKIDKKLVELGLKLSDRAAIIGVICGRMIVPGSERSTHYWLQNISALGELIATASFLGWIVAVLRFFAIDADSLLLPGYAFSFPLCGLSCGQLWVVMHFP